MSEWCLITDQHIGVRNDSKLFHNLFSDFYLNHFIPFVESKNIKHVVVAGDFFDRRKMINFESLKLAKDVFFTPLNDLGVEVHIILGNHDVFYKNTNEVNSLSLLISKDEFPNVTIYEHPETVEIGGIKALMLPWVNSENYLRSLEEIKTSDAQVVVSHLEMKGFEYHRGMVSDRGNFDKEVFDKFQFVFSGHYHHRSSRDNIHYLGTPYEITWADYGDQKGIHTFNGQDLTFHPNPKKLFIRIEYDDSEPNMLQTPLEDVKDRFVKIVVKKKNDPIAFEKLIDSYMVQGPADLNIIDETNRVKVLSEESEESPKDSLEVIKNFVYNELETDLNKERILKYMHELYVEANKVSEGE